MDRQTRDELEMQKLEFLGRIAEAIHATSRNTEWIKRHLATIEYQNERNIDIKKKHKILEKMIETI